LSRLQSTIKRKGESDGVTPGTQITAQGGNERFEVHKWEHNAPEGFTKRRSGIQEGKQHKKRPRHEGKEVGTICWVGETTFSKKVIGKGEKSKHNGCNVLEVSWVRRARQKHHGKVK